MSEWSDKGRRRKNIYMSLSLIMHITTTIITPIIEEKKKEWKILKPTEKKKKHHQINWRGACAAPACACMEAKVEGNEAWSEIPLAETRGMKSPAWPRARQHSPQRESFIWLRRDRVVAHESRLVSRGVGEGRVMMEEMITERGAN